jgi:hypothetical protein
MEISEELELTLTTQLKALRAEEEAQAGVIRGLKEAKSDRAALMPEIEKLNAIRAQISGIVRHTPPDTHTHTHTHTR